MDERSEAFKKEIKRKAFHFLSLLYTLAYFIFGRSIALKILIPVLAFEGLIEIARFSFPELNQKLIQAFGEIHREEETRKITGIFWTLLGSIVTFWLYRERLVVFTAMGYLIFSDVASALIGVRFGRHRTIAGRSLEGSLAFFAVSLIVGLFFLPPLIALEGTVFVSVVELLPLPGNDNFWVPVLSGFFLSLLMGRPIII